MIGWRKKQVANFFGVSVTAVDHWIAAGCPAETDPKTGRLVGMLLGEVMEWMRCHDNDQIRERFREARWRELTLISARVLFFESDRYVEALMKHGLDAQTADAAFRDVLKLASEALAGITRAPADELLRRPTEDNDH